VLVCRTCWQTLQDTISIVFINILFACSNSHDNEVTASVLKNAEIAATVLRYIAKEVYLVVVIAVPPATATDVVVRVVVVVVVVVQ
jgi:hypothetical protein